ncbi:TetR/AcrR family transcriptional regulator [Kocuria palustris]|uniref:TetR/AcrR family transcriptional regulator n=1 Tax=Kocuria palustris TaxID=71999 RepID=UPI0024693EF5|nr:helix-turn-helix domain-containing protein [Kocuria palustris]MDH5151127.1 helix-turn-helix domain containing protein [Kocuria palustris]
METRDGTGLGLSATLGRRERAKAEKRARILAAARALFEERGFQRTSMSEVARAADVAEGTVFQYAATKTELLMMVVDALWGAHERATATPPLSAFAAPGGSGTAPPAGEIADQIAALISPLVAAMCRWPEPATWVAREILFGAEMPHRRRVLDHVESLEEQIASRLQDSRAHASGAVGVTRDGAAGAAGGAPGAVEATAARLIVTGVLAELNRSRQGRNESENVDAALRRLIDLVVAGASVSR